VFRLTILATIISGRYRWSDAAGPDFSVCKWKRPTPNCHSSW